MTRKTVNDFAAYLRWLAQMRGHNVNWADRAMRDDVSVSAIETPAQQVVDFVAADLPALPTEAHGLRAQMSNGLQRSLDAQSLSTAFSELSSAPGCSTSSPTSPWLICF